MPTPFPFVAGSVLQAAQLNAISELPTRTLTGSGAAVAADSYSRVILNGSSITYTINTSTFSAGQVVELYNANSTAATIAAGAGVTLNGAAGLTLAQYQTAELYALSATSFVLWKSDVTQTAAGLTYVTGATFSAQTSVAFANSTFTSTYDYYLVQLDAKGDSAGQTVSVQVRDNSGTKSTAAYFGGSVAINQAGTQTNIGTNGATSFPLAANQNVAQCKWAFTVANPADATKRTVLHGTGGVVSAFNWGSFNFACLYNVDEAHTGLVFTFAGSSSGQYKVYGYANS